MFLTALENFLLYNFQNSASLAIFFIAILHVDYAKLLIKYNSIVTNL